MPTEVRGRITQAGRLHPTVQTICQLSGKNSSYVRVRAQCTRLSWLVHSTKGYNMGNLTACRPYLDNVSLHMQTSTACATAPPHWHCTKRNTKQAA
eukprot:6188871-Pleurochrysis_carterae.AAC.3